MAGMTLLGLVLLTAPAFLDAESRWISKGAGTAMLLIAASILFVVVFEALAKVGRNTPVNAATGLTALFGYIGTIKVLESENALLLAVLVIATFYIGWMGVAFVVLARLGRIIFSRRS